MPETSATTDLADWQVLLDSVRHRPAMYVGDTGINGLKELVRTLLDFFIDEFYVGRATTLSVTLHPDHSLTVSDNGSPVTADTVRGLETSQVLEASFTNTRHRPASRPASGIRTHFHDNDLPILNALSEVCSVATQDRKEATHMAFARGQRVPTEGSQSFPDTGSFGVHFRPDPAIFIHDSLNAEWLRAFLTERAVLAPGLQIRFCDETSGHSEVWRFPQGVAEFVANECAQDACVWSSPLRVQSTLGNFSLDVAVTFTRNPIFRCCSFANGRSTLNWGTHVAATRQGLATALRRHLGKPRTQMNQLLRGGVIAVAVNLPAAHYEGPTRGKLSNPEVEGWIRHFVSSSFEQLLSHNSDDVQAWREWMETADADHHRSR